MPKERQLVEMCSSRSVLCRSYPVLWSQIIPRESQLDGTCGCHLIVNPLCREEGHMDMRTDLLEGLTPSATGLNIPSFERLYESLPRMKTNVMHYSYE